MPIEEHRRHYFNFLMLGMNLAKFAKEIR